MPSRVVEMLMIQVAKLEADVATLLRWHKWQMGILAIILAAVFLRKL